MAQFHITIENYDHSGSVVKIARLSGSADATNVHEVNTAMLAVLEGTPSLDLIIDGTELEYVNSTAIGYLTDWYSRVTSTGGKLLLCSLRPNVLDTLSVVGLMNILPHYMTLDEAKLALIEGSTQAQPVGV